LPEGHIKIGIAWIIVIFLNLAALIGGFRISLIVGFISTLIVILGILYSVPPIAFKNRTWPAALANGLGHGSLVFLLGYLSAGGPLFDGIWKSLPYLLAVMAVYTGTTLPDIEGDAIAGKKTLAVVYKKQPTLYIMYSCFLLALAISIIIYDIPFLLAGLAASPIYILSFFHKSIDTAVIAVKISVIALSLAAVYAVPLYLGFLIILIIATRVYYKARFGIVYPSIK
jgi:4-hydroxybenzoate polyprenyltransferase